MSMLEGGRLSLIKEGGRRVLGTISIAGLCYFSVRYHPDSLLLLAATN